MMTDMQIKIFVKERDTAFINAVTKDDWDGVYRYCRRYRLRVPSKENVLKASIYKAVQECTGISNEVKNIAWEKCIALGFKPTMW